MRHVDEGVDSEGSDRPAPIAPLPPHRSLVLKLVLFPAGHLELLDVLVRVPPTRYKFQRDEPDRSRDRRVARIASRNASRFCSVTSYWMGTTTGPLPVEGSTCNRGVSQYAPGAAV